MDMMHPEEAVSSFLSRLRKPCHIVVACSGGGDSLGLLYALQKLKTADIRISVATVDHALRSGSRTEAEAVGIFCAERGLPHRILTWNSKKPESGLQAAAREARYALLAEHAHHIGAELMLTAHNYEDQLETLAMRKARDPEAESGISPLVLINGRTWLHRPFLAVRREAIRDYLRAAQVSWMEDPSNRNMDFERVRVRNEHATNSFVHDFEAVSRTQLDLSEQAAQFLLEHVQFARSCSVVDLAAFDSENKAHLFALLHLIALRGGGKHLIGRQERQGLVVFLQDADRRRYSVGGVVMEKRNGQLFIVHESRNILSLTLDARSQSVWNNRFLLANNGDRAARIEPGYVAPDLSSLLANEQVSCLPNRVRALMKLSDPVLIEGDRAKIEIKPVIACFGQFLPFERFPIAQVLAKGLGLEHFPLPPFG